MTNGSGFVVEYEYDIMDRVTNIAWKTTSGISLGGFAYEYDAVGRIVSRRHSLGKPSQPSQMSQSSHKTYTYYDLDRLASDGDVSYTYDAITGRWLSKDPIGLSGGLNLYAFCGNNPVLIVDRFGKNPLAIIGGVVAAAAIGYAIYKGYNYVQKVKSRMEKAGDNDLRSVVEGGVDCIGYLFENFGPHGVVPDKTTIITDPIDNYFMTPIRDKIIEKMRPRKGKKPCPDQMEEEIMPLQD